MFAPTVTGMTTHAETSLRERKKLQTRARIHRVAVRLAAQRGLDAVTVDEIAAEAEVSTRTFFNYFAGKDQAIVGFDPEMREHYAEAIIQAPASMGPLGCLEHAALTALLPGLAGGLKKQRLQVIEANPRLWPAMFGAGRQFDESATAALEQRLGLPEGDPFVQLVVGVASAAVRAGMHAQALLGIEADDAVRAADRKSVV